MKKGSLNISIEMIVIIVIAMTLLGLGLGFVRSQFKAISETSITVQEQTRQAILDDLRVGNKKLSFPTDRFKLTPGEKKDLAFGVKNLEDGDVKFVINITKRDNTTKEFKPLDSSEGGDGEFFWDDSIQKLPAGEARVFGVLHQAEGSKGTYLYKVTISCDTTTACSSAEYDSKTFFVTVS